MSVSVFWLNSGSDSVFLVLQSLMSQEEKEGVISRHTRSPTATLGDVPGRKKGARDTWEIPICVLVRIQEFFWIGGIVCPPSHLYYWNGFVCLGGDAHLFVCHVCLLSLILSYL